MIIEAATAAWFCFNPLVCYDQAHVKVFGPKVATFITDGRSTAPILIDCTTKSHQVISAEGIVEAPFEPNSASALICERYAPGS